MSSKRVFQIMLAALVLSAALSVGCVVAANRLLEKRADKLHELKLENLVLEQQQVALAQAKKDVAKYSDLKSIAKSVVPQEKDQAKTVREIVNFAAGSGIAIQTISFPTSNLGAPLPVPAGGIGAALTPKTTAAPTQVKPVEGIPGVYQLEVSVQSDDAKPISFDQLIDFLQRLEQNRRTAQVSNISIRQPNNKDRSKLAFTLSVNVYIQP